MNEKARALLAKKAASELLTLTNEQKNQVLVDVAQALIANQEPIFKANQQDIAQSSHLSVAMIDRLTLNTKRLQAMADGLIALTHFNNPIGNILETKTMYNGCIIEKISVPFGLVGIIFEARPNVTVDAFGLCFKSGNALYCRGGKEAINTNLALVSVIQKVLVTHQLNPACLTLVETTDREKVDEMLTMHGIIDVIIPRGSASFIDKVVRTATVPVIETGAGICMMYVDKDADLNKAIEILDNGKTQRISVCNALESVVIHQDIVKDFLPLMLERFNQRVEIRGDQVLCQLDARIIPAQPEDYNTEFLDYIISTKTVASLTEAIDFINQHHTQHSDVIITENVESANQFCTAIDAAVVYVNASTRFSDGAEFGMGAEIGISTQKLHARGPMGLEALTTYKYLVKGNGQIRQ